MRKTALVLAAVLVAVGPGTARAQQPAPKPPVKTDDLVRARALDQQGAKAYADGRYNDAIRYFEEAYRLGGPPFELWNIAKCHVRMDQPEQAAEVLERYLALPNLPPDDRAEAQEQLDALRKRPSSLTVASSPGGATVAVDGRAVQGTTPVTVSVPPGPHTVTVTLDKHVPYSAQVEAKYGRAVILDAPLVDEASAPKVPPYASGPRIALRGWLALVVPRHGTIGGNATVGGIVSGTYRFANIGPTAFALGGLASINHDAWDNTVGSPNVVPGCPRLESPNGAAASSLLGLVTAGWDLGPRLRAHALGGFGAAFYSVGDDVGGDLFAPSCVPKTGVRPALLVGAQVDYAITPLIRLSALPLTAQLHQAFDNARTAPKDASGLWLRFSIALGMGVDF